MTVARAYAMYNPLRVFVALGLLLSVAGLLPVLRFLYFYAIGDGGGHVQSLILGGVLIILGTLSIMFGIVADLVGRNRQLLETTLERVRRMEDGRDAGSDLAGPASCNSASHDRAA